MRASCFSGAFLVLLAACAQQQERASLSDIRLGPQSAQATKFDASVDSPGTMTRWYADNGGTMLRFEGEEAGLLRFYFERDASKGEPLRMTIWSTQDGQSVRWRSGDVEARYTPHDCSLTLGRCIFRGENSRLGARLIEWNASQQDGLWSYTMHLVAPGERRILEEGAFTVDPRGYVLERTCFEYRGGVRKERWTKRAQ